MRISTSMIYNSGVSTINNKTSSLLHTQQQVSTGRRMVTPADDPVAAARALEVSSAQAVNAQQATNLNNSKSALGLEESQLSSVNDLLARVRELVVQAGNSSLSTSDRNSIASELRSDYDQLQGIANTADGNGNYVFSGYMGSTMPFGGSLDVLNQLPGNEITYNGDSGQRKLQVSAVRQLPVSDAGDNVFKRIVNGNGYFTTSFAATTITSGVTNNGNAGSGIINGGVVTNPTAWNNSAIKNVNIVFSVDSSVIPPKTYYDLVDTTAYANGTSTSGTSLITGQSYSMPLSSSSAPAAATSGMLQPYTDGQPISLSGSYASPGTTFDLGSTVIITGSPATGDRFSLAPSSTQSIFKTIANVVSALENTSSTTTSGMAALANNVGFALTNIDQATDHLLTVRASIGSRLSEVDTLSNVNQDVDLQYQQNLSDLQDLDYAKTITSLTRQQTDLQAAQISFTSTTKLSLFNYIS